MEYRKLGDSNLKVSAVGLGTMTFGAQTSESEAFKQLDLAYAHGITLFDTAENYPAPMDAVTQGNSERILGKWVKSRGVREKVVIATKVSGPGSGLRDTQHIRGENRCLNDINIREAVENSLQRLQTDYIDLYQVHWSERPITTLRKARYSHIPDLGNQVPIVETLQALADQVSRGVVREIGVCNESPWGVMHYLHLSTQPGLPRIASVQNSYNLVDRLFDCGLAEVCMRENVGMIAYSPLASGLLTGKYQQGKSLEGSRSSLFKGFEARFSPALLEASLAYTKLASEYGLDPASMALAFVRQQPFVASSLMAASKLEQLQKNLKSLDVTLDRSLLKAINSIHDRHPNPS